jgi:hypothetical protein
MAEPHPLGEFSATLKNVYLPIRKKAWPKMSVLAAQARKIGPETAKFAGNDLFFDVVLSGVGGFVAVKPGFAPESLVAKEKQGRLGIARNYAKLFVDGLALKATADSKGSYISVAKKLMEDVMDQWQIEQNRVLHGDGLAIRALGCGQKLGDCSSPATPRMVSPALDRATCTWKLATRSPSTRARPVADRDHW